MVGAPSAGQLQLSVVGQPLSVQRFSGHLLDSTVLAWQPVFSSTFLLGRYVTTANRYLEIQRLFCSHMDL